MWGLVPKALEKNDLETALEDEVSRISADGKVKASLRLSGKRRELPADVQAAILRICQESLTNVKRHAGATEVSVNLTFSRKDTCLEVQDNGVGLDFDEEADSGQGGFGLVGMEQRARSLGGTFKVRRAEGGGTLVEARVPIT